MSGFLFAFLAALLATFGARDQVTVAYLTRVQGKRPLLLVIALLSAGLTTAAAAWVARRTGTGMIPDARALFAVLALLIAGAELLVLGPRKAAAEPTHSLFAAFIVLLSQQVTDASRFLVLALAVGTASPVTAGIGGALGSGAAIVAGWAMPELAETPRWRVCRRIGGGLLIATGITVGTRILIA